MSYSDGGGRSIRKSNNRSPKKLRVTKAENSDRTTTTISYNNRFGEGSHNPPSIHKRNLYVVSFPLIFLFNILRSLIYQLFVVFKYLYASTSYLIRRRQVTKNTCQLEIVVDRETADNLLQVSTREDESMSQIVKRTGPGPGDPLLAKQKHHHRRAFEFISKALKIDEENEGIFLFLFIIRFKFR